jgi:hypothetical protein
MKHFKHVLILIALSLSLSSCWPTPSRQARGQLGEPALLTGRADNAPGRALSLKLELRRRPSRVIDFVGNGSINAAGDFSIALPGLAQMRPYIDPLEPRYQRLGTCRKISVTPSSTQTSEKFNLAVFDGATQVGRISLEPSVNNVLGDVATFILFTDQDVDINVVCSQDTITNHFHAHIDKGWFVDINEWYDTANLHEFVDEIPNVNRWQYSSLP